MFRLRLLWCGEKYNSFWIFLEFCFFSSFWFSETSNQDFSNRTSKHCLVDDDFLLFFFQPSFHEANDGIGKTKDQENQCQSCTFQIPRVHIEDFKGWKKWVKLAHLHHQQSSCWDQDFLIFYLLMDQQKQSLTKLDCIRDRISLNFQVFLGFFAWTCRRTSRWWVETCWKFLENCKAYQMTILRPIHPVHPVDRN